MKSRRKGSCPICYSLDLFGDKWTLLILRDLLFFKKSNYKDFLNSNEKISTNILADRLKALLENGFVTKRDDPENRQWNIYSPTKKATSLTPILKEIIKWGLKHGEGTKVPLSYRRV